MKSLRDYIKDNGIKEVWIKVLVSALNESNPEIMIWEEKVYMQNIEKDSFERTTIIDVLKFVYTILENNIAIGYKGDVLEKAFVEFLLNEIEDNTPEGLLKVFNKY